jgi:hypothetical protein
MFRRIIARKRNVVVLTAIAALAVAGAAFAYLTSTGSGSGSGTVSSATQSVALTGSLGAPLSKIGDTETFTVNAKNNGSSPVYVNSVALGNVSVAAGCAEPGAADASATTKNDSFQFTNLTPSPTEVQPGDTQPVATVSVTFNDEQSVQDSCLSGFSLPNMGSK